MKMKWLVVLLCLCLWMGLFALSAFAQEEVETSTIRLEVFYPLDYEGLKCGGIAVYAPLDGTVTNYIGNHEIEISEGETLYYRALDTVGDLLPVQGTDSWEDMVPREELDGVFYNALTSESGVETVIVEYVSRTAVRQGVETELNGQYTGAYVVELTVAYPAAVFSGRAYGVENAYEVEKTGGIRQVKDGETVAEYVGNGAQIFTEGTFQFYPIEMEGMDWRVHYRGPFGGGNWATALPPEAGEPAALEAPLEISGPGASILLTYFPKE